MSSPKDLITTAYYPELAKIINNGPTAIERLELECGMCQDKMSNTEDKTCDAIIFPCGHMFCPPCVKEYRTHTLSNDIPYKCPVCRTDLKGKICGCPGDKDTLFEPTQHQDESLLARLKEEISNPEGPCVSCQMATLVRNLRRIALYEHDPAPLIKDGHMLRVTAQKRDDKEVRAESDNTEVVRQLPISAELMELFSLAGRGLDTVWNGLAPEDESSLFDFELAICKRYPEEHKDWPHRRGQMDFVERVGWRRPDSTERSRLLEAFKGAIELGEAFISDEDYREHQRRMRNQERLEVIFFETLELEEEMQAAGMN
ncbi:hypothetical protein LB504_002245 [Fusarium proliferatum]|nr:hypothetical protein LB504_002245 [Fusarium proliferatum]